MDKRTDQTYRLSFGGHESFPFRQGWIRKGVMAVKADPGVFQADDAVVRLGVGKNMVRSIRTWCLATQMLEEAPAPAVGRLSKPEPSPPLPFEGDAPTAARGKTLRVSRVAELLFDEATGDPYLEDPASLWLLHWLLVRNRDRLSLWRLAFMELKENEFTKEELADLAESASSGTRPLPPSAAAREVDVFVRTYAAGRGKASEEDFGCPLAELGLIVPGGHDRYAFVVGPKRSLPFAVFGFALVQFLAERESPEATLSDIAYLPGSPGQAFRLDEDTVVGHIRELQRAAPDRWIVDVDGPYRRIGVREMVDPVALLAAYYRGVQVDEVAAR